MAIVDVKLVSGFSVNEKTLQRVSLEINVLKSGPACQHNPLFFMMYIIVQPSWKLVYSMCHYISIHIQLASHELFKIVQHALGNILLHKGNCLQSETGRTGLVQPSTTTTLKIRGNAP